jgi:hypothetical protein
MQAPEFAFAYHCTQNFVQPILVLRIAKKEQKEL